MQRRKFIKKTGFASLTTLLGTEIVFANSLPADYQLIAFQDPDPFKMFHKDSQMVLLNDKPWNMEAQAHLLDDKITPNKFMFIRNNGNIPKEIDVDNWTITFDGESIVQEKTFTIKELKSKSDVAKVLYH